MSFKKTKKIVSILLIFCFLFSDLARANPALVSFSSRVEAKPPLEISLPSELGTVRETYLPDRNSTTPLIFYLQTVHANYESALKVKEIIDYLTKQYKARLIFAEGASDRLHPEFLQFFPDSKRNAQMLDVLTQKGELTGVDLSLWDSLYNKPNRMEAVGVESISFYRGAFKDFKKVIGNLNESEALVEKKKMKLDAEASKVFSKEFRELVEIWQRLQSNRRDLNTLVQYLRGEAKKNLEIDFEDPFSQFEWPQLTRLVLLQELEKRINHSEFKKEKVKLTKWLHEKKIHSNFIENLGAKNLKTPRLFYENFLREAYPFGFRFKDYPQITYQAASHVLQSEVEAQSLFLEFDRLFEKLIQAKAKSKSELALFRKYQRLLLLQKLLRLELTREEWEKVKKVNVGAPFMAPAQRKGAMNRAPTKIDRLVHSALHFYRICEQREKIFYKKIRNEMDSRHEKVAILVTGGFHSEGMQQIFKEKGIGFASIQPRITNEMNSSLYRQIMLRQAHIEKPPALEPAHFFGNANYTRAELRRFEGVMREISLEELPNPWMQDRRDFLQSIAARSQRRSEVRARGLGTSDRRIFLQTALTNVFSAFISDWALPASVLTGKVGSQAQGANAFDLANFFAETLGLQITHLNKFFKLDPELSNEADWPLYNTLWIPTREKLKPMFADWIRGNSDYFKTAWFSALRQAESESGGKSYEEKLDRAQVLFGDGFNDDFRRNIGGSIGDATKLAPDRRFRSPIAPIIEAWSQANLRIAQYLSQLPEYLKQELGQEIKGGSLSFNQFEDFQDYIQKKEWDEDAWSRWETDGGRNFVRSASESRRSEVRTDIPVIQDLKSVASEILVRYKASSTTEDFIHSEEIGRFYQLLKQLSEQKGIKPEELPEWARETLTIDQLMRYDEEIIAGGIFGRYSFLENQILNFILKILPPGTPKPDLISSPNISPHKKSPPAPPRPAAPASKSLRQNEYFEFELGNQIITSRDDRLEEILSLIKKGEEIPEKLQRLTPRIARGRGEVEIATVRSGSVKKAIYRVASSYFAGKDVTPLIKKTGEGIYSLGLEVTSEITEAPFIVSSFIFARNGQLIIEPEPSNLEANEKMLPKEIPFSTFPVIQEIIYEIAQGVLPQKLRVIHEEDLTDKGGGLFTTSFVNFWKQDVRLNKLGGYANPILKIDPTPEIASDAWVASLWMRAEGNRPEVPFASIVIYANQKFTQTRPFTRGKTGFTHVQGEVPSAGRTFRDVFKAIWNIYWLANGGLQRPADDLIPVESGRDLYLYQMSGKTISILLGREFNHGTTTRSWVHFPGISTDARGVRYQNSETKTEKFFLLYNQNRFQEPQEVSAQGRETIEPPEPLKNFVAEPGPLFHTALTKQERFLLIKKRHEILAEMHALDQRRKAIGSEPDEKQRRVELQELRESYTRLAAFARDLSAVQVTGDYTGREYLRPLLHFSRASQIDRIEMGEEKRELFYHLLSEVVNRKATEETFDALAENFSSWKNSETVETIAIKLPVDRKENYPRVFPAGENIRPWIPLGTYSKDWILITVQREKKGKDQKDYLRLRLYDPDRLEELFDSFYFDPAAGEYVSSRKEWQRYFSEDADAGIPGDIVAASLTEEGRADLFPEFEKNGKQFYGVVPLGPALFEEVDHQGFYPFGTRGRGSTFFFKIREEAGREKVFAYGSAQTAPENLIGVYEWNTEERSLSLEEQGGLGFSLVDGPAIWEMAGTHDEKSTASVLKDWVSGQGLGNLEITQKAYVGTRSKVSLPVPPGSQTANNTKLALTGSELGAPVYLRNVPEESGQETRALDLYVQGELRQRAFYSSQAPDGVNALLEVIRRFRNLSSDPGGKIPPPLLLHIPGSWKMGDELELIDTGRGLTGKRRGSNVFSNAFGDARAMKIPFDFMWIEFGKVLERGALRPVMYFIPVEKEKRKAVLALRVVEVEKSQFRYESYGTAGYDVSTIVIPEMEEHGYYRPLDAVVYPEMLHWRLISVEKELGGEKFGSENKVAEAVNQTVEGDQPFPENILIAAPEQAPPKRTAAVQTPRSPPRAQTIPPALPTPKPMPVLLPPRLERPFRPPAPLPEKKSTPLESPMPSFGKTLPSQVMQLQLPKEIRDLDQQLFFEIPNAAYARRVVAFENLQSQYHALENQLQNAPPIPSKPISDSDPAELWERFRANARKKDFFRMRRPDPLLIHRPLEYDWKKDSFSRLSLDGTNILEKTVHEIQSLNPRMEYFWIEAAPSFSATRRVPALYIVGLNIKSGNISQIHRWIEIKPGKFIQDKGPEGYSFAQVFPEIIFERSGYVLPGKELGGREWIASRLRRVKEESEVERKPWDELENGVKAFLETNFLTDLNAARAAEAWIGPSLLEIPFFIPFKNLDRIFALAQALTEGKTQPSDFLREITHTHELASFLGYQRFRLEPLERLAESIEDKKIEPEKALAMAKDIARKILNSRAGLLHVDRKISLPQKKTPKTSRPKAKFPLPVVSEPPIEPVIPVTPVEVQAPVEETLQEKWQKEFDETNAFQGMDQEGKNKSQRALDLTLRYDWQRAQGEIDNTEELREHMMNLWNVVNPEALQDDEKIYYFVLTARLLSDTGQPPKDIAENVEKALILLEQQLPRDREKELQLEQSLRGLDPENPTLRKRDQAKQIEGDLRSLEASIRSHTRIEEKEEHFKEQIEALEKRIDALNEFNDVRVSAPLRHQLEMVRLSLAVRLIQSRIQKLKREAHSRQIQERRDFEQRANAILDDIQSLKRFGQAAFEQKDALQAQLGEAYQIFEEKSGGNSNPGSESSSGKNHPRRSEVRAIDGEILITAGEAIRKGLPSLVRPNWSTVHQLLEPLPSLAGQRVSEILPTEKLSWWLTSEAFKGAGHLSKKTQRDVIELLETSKNPSLISLLIEDYDNGAPLFSPYFDELADSYGPYHQKELQTLVRQFAERSAILLGLVPPPLKNWPGRVDPIELQYFAREFFHFQDALADVLGSWEHKEFAKDPVKVLYELFGSKDSMGRSSPISLEDLRYLLTGSRKAVVAFPLQELIDFFPFLRYVSIAIRKTAERGEALEIKNILRHLPKESAEITLEIDRDVLITRALNILGVTRSEVRTNPQNRESLVNQAYDQADELFSRLMQQVIDLVNREQPGLFFFHPLPRMGAILFDAEGNAIGSGVNGFAQQHAERLAILNGFENIFNGMLQKGIFFPDEKRIRTTIQYLQTLLVVSGQWEEFPERGLKLIEWLNGRLDHPMRDKFLFINHEPCARCADFIEHVGIRNVVFGTRDERQTKNGGDRLEQKGIHVISGILERQAARQRKILNFIVVHPLLSRLHYGLFRKIHRFLYFLYANLRYGKTLRLLREQLQQYETPQTLSSLLSSTSSRSEARMQNGKEDFLYYAFNKPRGVVSNRPDHGFSKSIYDIFYRETRRNPNEFFSMGRLDRDVDGLILFTNDPSMLSILMPVSHIEKNYLVTVEGRFTEEDAKRLRSGIEIVTQDRTTHEPLRYMTKPAQVEIVSSGQWRSILHLYITEGRYHQVKLMMEAAGHPVLVLTRKGIGGIELDKNLHLRPGKVERLEGGLLEQLLQVRDAALLKLDTFEKEKSKSALHHYLGFKDFDWEGTREFAAQRIRNLLGRLETQSSSWEILAELFQGEITNPQFVIHLFTQLAESFPQQVRDLLFPMIQNRDIPLAIQKVAFQILLEIQDRERERNGLPALRSEVRRQGTEFIVGLEKIMSKEAASKKLGREIDLSKQYSAYFEKVYAGLPADVRKMMDFNLMDKDFGYQKKDPLAAWTVLSLYLLQRGNLTSEDFQKLNRLARRYYRLKPYGFISPVLAFVMSLGGFYVGEEVEWRTHPRLTKNLQKLPGPYKYWAIATDLLFVAFHIRRGLVTSEELDLNSYISNVHFVLETLEKGWLDLDVPISKREEERIWKALKISVVQYLVSIFGFYTDETAGRKLYQINERIAYNQRTALDFSKWKSRDKMKKVLEKHQEIILKTLAEVRAMEKRQGFTYANAVWMWFRYIYSKLPRWEDAQGRPVPVERGLLNPSKKNFSRVADIFVRILDWDTRRVEGILENSAEAEQIYDLLAATIKNLGSRSRKPALRSEMRRREDQRRTLAFPISTVEMPFNISPQLILGSDGAFLIPVSFLADLGTGGIFGVRLNPQDRNEKRHLLEIFAAEMARQDQTPPPEIQNKISSTRILKNMFSARQALRRIFDYRGDRLAAVDFDPWILKTAVDSNLGYSAFVFGSLEKVENFRSELRKYAKDHYSIELPANFQVIGADSPDRLAHLVQQMVSTQASPVGIVAQSPVIFGKLSFRAKPAVLRVVGSSEAVIQNAAGFVTDEWLLRQNLPFEMQLRILEGRELDFEHRWADLIRELRPQESVKASA